MTNYVETQNHNFFASVTGVYIIFVVMCLFYYFFFYVIAEKQ